MLKTTINLTELSFNFCSDKVIDDFYNEKTRELLNKEKWLKDNNEFIEQNIKVIAKAINNGLIPDNKLETIWQFQVNKAKEAAKSLININNNLKQYVKEIKSEVAKKLSQYLPDWSIKNASIFFTMNENADYYMENNCITVDLERLLWEKDPLEKVKQGITHEVFHLWMLEKVIWSNSKKAKTSNLKLRKQIIFKNIDEGLAVFVSDQSLKEHHVKLGTNFNEYKAESFKAFNEFVKEDNEQKLNIIKNTAFQNMGNFYVVGNEIVKTVFKYEGIELFKELIKDCRDNPMLFLKYYQKICIKNNKLLIIYL